MIHTFGYGTEVQQIEIPEENLYRELLANDTVEKNPQDADVRYSLEHPIASGRLKDLIRPGEKIAIVNKRRNASDADCQGYAGAPGGAWRRRRRF